MNTFFCLKTPSWQTYRSEELVVHDKPLVVVGAAVLLGESVRPLLARLGSAIMIINTSNLSEEMQPGATVDYLCTFGRLRP